MGGIIRGDVVETSDVLVENKPKIEKDEREAVARPAEGDTDPTLPGASGKTPE